MAQTIPTSARIEPWTPPAFEQRDPKPIFMLQTPTPFERDTLSSTLFRMGLREVTQEIVRATLIDCLYDVYKEAEAEEHAVALEIFWQTSAADEQAFAIWHEQELERHRDIAHGAPERPADPMPVAVTSPRQKAKAQLLVDHLTASSKRVGDLLERRMDFSRQQGIALVRIGLVAIEDLEGAPALKRAADGLLPVTQVDQVRDLLTDDAWLQLIGRIDEGYRFTEEDRKNLGLPLEKPSDPTGSAEPSGESASRDGKSTGSSTGPAPTDASATTTG